MINIRRAFQKKKKGKTIFFMLFLLKVKESKGMNTISVFWYFPVISQD